MLRPRFFCPSALLLLILCPASVLKPQTGGSRQDKFPYPEKLTYRVEWRMITAGEVRIDLTTPGQNNWQTDLHIESAGLLTRLYRVLDYYKVVTDSGFCPVSSYLDAQEGKHHKITRLTFDAVQHKVRYDLHDLEVNTNKHQELETPPCTYEIVGGLASLRTVEPGKSVALPITDGKKVVTAKVEAQGKEKIVIDGRTYATTRYEAFLFDNVLYRRKGRLLLWLTDDAERLPVQFRFQMGFPIGNVTISLEKQERK